MLLRVTIGPHRLVSASVDRYVPSGINLDSLAFLGVQFWLLSGGVLELHCHYWHSGGSLLLTTLTYVLKPNVRQQLLLV